MRGHVAFPLTAAGFQAEVQRLGQGQSRPQVPCLVGPFRQRDARIRRQQAAAFRAARP